MAKYDCLMPRSGRISSPRVTASVRSSIHGINNICKAYNPSISELKAKSGLHSKKNSSENTIPLVLSQPVVEHKFKISRKAIRNQGRSYIKPESQIESIDIKNKNITIQSFKMPNGRARKCVSKRVNRKIKSRVRIASKKIQKAVNETCSQLMIFLDKKEAKQRIKGTMSSFRSD
ncbi:unnamed protein product [Moneuplotes crassus]|uniref:Uncharacterized protein n=1 Tax=Euplotes crassus TaxID=5936 RepID=A0AAD2CYX1_EUPCR|nr:unnamed protein product [Moneuplotes crassus]